MLRDNWTSTWSGSGSKDQWETYGLMLLSLLLSETSFPASVHFLIPPRVKAIDKSIPITPRRYRLILLLYVILVELLVIMQGYLRVNQFLSCNMVGKIPVSALPIVDELDIILALFPELTE